MEELIAAALARWRAGDAGGAAALFAADGRFVETGGATIAGRAALAAHFARFLGGRPWRIEIERTIVGGEEAALAYRFATEGRDGTWHERAGCALVTARDGTIAEWREYAG